MNLYRNLLRFNDLWGRHGVWCRRSDEKKQIKREGGAHSTVTPRAKVILYRCPMIYGDGMVCGDGAAMLRAQNAGEHGWAARRKSRPGEAGRTQHRDTTCKSDSIQMPNDLWGWHGMWYRAPSRQRENLEIRHIPLSQRHKRYSRNSNPTLMPRRYKWTGIPSCHGTGTARR